MINLEVTPVEGKRALREFIALPYALYQADPHWVPAVWMDYRGLFETRTHPFCAHAQLQGFIVQHGAKVVGRIAAIIDREFDRVHNERAGFFGFFESIDEPEVANRLLQAAWHWLRQRGARYLRGPMNPSANYECGLLVEGFDSSPKIMMPYNPPYYAALLEGAGFYRVKDLYAYYLDREALTLERAARLARHAVEANQVRIRPIRMTDFEREVEVVLKAYNSAWSENWGFVPMTREECFFLARELRPIAVPDLVLMAEVSGRLAGFVLALPDINQALKGSHCQSVWWNTLRVFWRKRCITSMRVVLLGVEKRYRAAGVGAALYAEIVRQGMRLGYQDCEMSWILDDNVLMQRSIELLGGKKYKTYRLYQRD